MKKFLILLIGFMFLFGCIGQDNNKSDLNNTPNIDIKNNVDTNIAINKNNDINFETGKLKIENVLSELGYNKTPIADLKAEDVNSAYNKILKLREEFLLNGTKKDKTKLVDFIDITINNIEVLNKTKQMEIYNDKTIAILTEISTTNNCKPEYENDFKTYIGFSYDILKLYKINLEKVNEFEKKYNIEYDLLGEKIAISERDNVLGKLEKIDFSTSEDFSKEYYKFLCNNLSMQKDINNLDQMCQQKDEIISSLNKNKNEAFVFINKYWSVFSLLNLFNSGTEISPETMNTQYETQIAQYTKMIEDSCTTGCKSTLFGVLNYSADSNNGLFKVDFKNRTGKAVEIGKVGLTSYSLYNDELSSYVNKKIETDENFSVVFPMEGVIKFNLEKGQLYDVALSVNDLNFNVIEDIYCTGKVE